MDFSRPLEEIFHNFSTDSEITITGWTSEDRPHSYKLRTRKIETIITLLINKKE